MSWLDWMTLRWPDVLWHIIPGLVIYQIIGTIRHELAHALAYKLCGWKITGIYVLPHKHNDTFYWGRITAELQGGAKHSVHLYMAPYEIALLSVLGWFAVANWLPPPWVANEQLAWNLWAMVTAQFLISPIVDTAYNLWKYIRRNSGDFRQAITYWETH